MKIDESTFSLNKHQITKHSTVYLFSCALKAIRKIAHSDNRYVESLSLSPSLALAHIRSIRNEKCLIQARSDANMHAFFDGPFDFSLPLTSEVGICQKRLN